MNTKIDTKFVRLAGLSVCLFLAPALWAQSAASDAGSAGGKSNAPATNSTAALDSQSDKAAPAPAKPARDPHTKPGSDYPHWEWFLGYSYFNGRVGSGISSYNANGGSSSIAYNFNRWLGVVADFGGYHAGTINHISVDANQYSYLFGPR